MRPRLIGEFAEDYMTMIADVYKFALSFWDAEENGGQAPQL